MCIISFGLPLSGEATPTEWFSSLIVNGCGFFEYPTLCSDPFVGLLNGQTDGQLASSICDNAVVILKWPLVSLMNCYSIFTRAWC